jgi:hypothetical protein
VSGPWPWVGHALLGAYHGINPAMGWLFAVARGLHERRRGAVVQSLLPIALGHEASLVLVVGLAGAAGLVAPPAAVRGGAAVALVAFGIFKFARPRSHPRWVGFRVTLPELGLWSLLMSTAHGAGLMLVPVLLKLSSPAEPMQGMDGHADHAAHAADTAGPAILADLAAVGLHTLAMFLAMGAIAVVIYEKFDVMILKRAWFNVDLLWAGALVAAGVVTLFV